MPELDLQLSLFERLYLRYCKLERMARSMVFGMQPSGDAANDAFDSAYDQLEMGISRIRRILKKRYGLWATD